MVRRLILFVFLVIAAGSAWAEATHWVRDRIVISMRDAPGSDAQVIRTISSGTGMQILERSGNGAYARVKLDNGVEGWVATRYLVDKPIAAMRLAKMEKEWKRFKEENEQLRKELEDLQELSGDLEAVRRLRAENARLTAEVERFKELNTEPLALANENEQLRSRNLAIDKELQLVRQELQVAKDRSDRDWFLLGAGVLIAGILVGIALPRLRLRKRDSWEL
ncbi:MAG TPA: TIGR04211 family SH3 domain-containing protein [Gammaproteobacteria bacterium]|nr:TIGR04211 family SH3 domain-containing protein [Gammaproteobacteria bacterium]